jgi:hypothetical protein
VRWLGPAPKVLRAKHIAHPVVLAWGLHVCWLCACLKGYWVYMFAGCAHASRDTGSICLRS